MRYRFFTCDVFTNTRFGGNQLAVLPQADGLRGTQMQQIAREFNFSETAFVLPAQAGTPAESAYSRRRTRCRSPDTPISGQPSYWRTWTYSDRSKR